VVATGRVVVVVAVDVALVSTVEAVVTPVLVGCAVLLVVCAMVCEVVSVTSAAAVGVTVVILILAATDFLNSIFVAARSSRRVWLLSRLYRLK